jgi:hypothetical protein
MQPCAMSSDFLELMPAELYRVGPDFDWIVVAFHVGGVLLEQGHVLIQRPHGELQVRQESVIPSPGA